MRFKNQLVLEPKLVGLVAAVVAGQLFFNGSIDLVSTLASAVVVYAWWSSG
jgi:hypothetical protein